MTSIQVSCRASFYRQLYYLHPLRHGPLHDPGLAAHLLKGREPWSFRNGKRDAETTLSADDPACKPIDYPKPDGVLSFDLLSNLALSGVKHEHDQPAHLRIKEGMESVASEVRLYRWNQATIERFPSICIAFCASSKKPTLKNNG